MTRRPDDPEREGGGLGGWSRRKLAARRAEVEALPEAAEVEPVAAPEPDVVDEAYIAALPPIETIVAGTDIKAFLARGVPASLKNAALRRLWSATPGVRDYADPAVDYAYDWNTPGGVPGGGGILSESGVARMVKDLIGGTRTAEDWDGSGPDGAERDVASAANASDESGVESVPPEPDVAPAAVRRTEASVGKERAPDTDDPESEAGGRVAVDAVAQPRRHGGAVPE
jgi:hypothetical protein